MNNWYRWKWTYINSTGTVKKCRVKVNGDNLFSSYKPILTSAVNHWNSLDTVYGPEKDKVYCYLVDWDNSKVDFFSAGSGSWFYGAAFAEKQAITLYKNSNGVWSRNPNTGVTGTFTSGTVSYARVYSKSFSTSSAYANRNQYYYRHEIGHVLGMGHVEPLAHNTIMEPFYANVHIVTSYDISVLEGFYPNP